MKTLVDTSESVSEDALADAERRRGPGLSTDEREIILAVADDEQAWHVFSDSKRAVNTRLLKIARKCGVEPQRVGHGYELTLPLAAVRFAAPRRLSERERAQRRVAAAARTAPESHKGRAAAGSEGP